MSNFAAFEGQPLLPRLTIDAVGKHTGTVIWLHGLGADGHDFAPIIPALGIAERGIKTVLPHAPSIPVTINGGMTMPAWYDIAMTDLGPAVAGGGARVHDEAGIRETTARIEDLIAEERVNGIRPERIVIAGFSQGGAIALHAGIRYGHRLAGICALSTYLVLADLAVTERSDANRDVPIFQAHGTFDPVVTLDRGAGSREWLATHGYAVEWKTYPMAHQVCPDEVDDLIAWFQRVLP